MKLTVPQYRLLVSLVDDPRPIWDGYKPAKKLVELGLARWRHCRYRTYLEITQAGKDRI